MGKYGLITIHDTLNYGSLLQTFGLFKALEQLGVDIELIDYKCKAIAERETTYALNELKKPTDIIRFFMYHPSLKKRRDNMWQFIRDNLKVSRQYNRDTIAESNACYDGFVVGSDIVWGMNITGKDFSYMLDFAEDEKSKISFASSVGTKWGNEDSEHVATLLSRFDAIGVREQLAAKWVGELLNKDIQVTCDPTMLWDRKFWNQYVVDNYAPKEKYILVYMTTKDQKNIKDAIKYGKEHNLEVYYLNFNRAVSGVHNIGPMTVQEWISLFANAEVIFSASYHGLLFALYFQKALFYYNRGNKSRMISFGNELGITHREGTDENILADIEIDFSKVDHVLEEKRKYSWEWLADKLCK